MKPFNCIDIEIQNLITDPKDFRLEITNKDEYEGKGLNRR